MSEASLPSEAVEGLKELRKASLILIIAELLAGIGGLTIITSLLSMITSPQIWIGGALLGFGASIVISIVGFILILIASYAYLIPSLNHLRNYDATSFGTPCTLVELGFIWGVIVTLIGFVLILVLLVIPPLILVGFGIALIGSILILLGYIGLIIAMFKLNDKFNEVLFLVAGILFIIGIFISILSFIAWILIYVGTGTVLRRIQQQA